MTKTETLDSDIKSPICDLCEDGLKPTHVATSIVYGGNTHFVFREVTQYSILYIIEYLKF